LTKQRRLFPFAVRSWGGSLLRAALLASERKSGASRGTMPLLRAMSDTLHDQRRFAVVILAAGQGTRMRSDIHKVLHPIASRPVLLHLLDCVDALGADKRVVVVGKGREQVEAAIAGRDVTVAIQAEQKGTGHAVSRQPRRCKVTTVRLSSFMATRRLSGRKRCVE